MKSIAVFGASGFIGTTFVEKVLARGDCEVRPFIHSGRNAWRLARLGIPLEEANVLDRAGLERAVSGCTHIVNCIMGPRRVMFEGLRNLLQVSQRCGVQRFVHLSSITAYGDPPLPASVVESAPARPARGTYGWIKDTQDHLVFEASKRGLPAVVLCPPVVTGPRSTQLMVLLRNINERRFAQIADGAAPFAVVDVDNLAHAMVLALDSPDPDGRRIFVLDDVVPSWAEVIREVEPVFEPGVDYPVISEEEARLRIDGMRGERGSLVRTARHLLSPQVRMVLTKDPLIGSAARLAKRFLPRSLISAIKNAKRSAAGPVVLARSPKPLFEPIQLARQLRGVRHCGARAEEVLGYQPLITFQESMARFREWYGCERGWTGEGGDLVRLLDA